MERIGMGRQTSGGAMICSGLEVGLGEDEVRGL